MGLDLIAAIGGALVSLLVAGIASTKLVQKSLLLILRTKKEPAKPYSVTLSELTTSLTKASREVDAVLGELA